MIISARQISAPRKLPRVRGAPQRRGLAFEKSVHKSLRDQLAGGPKILHNPWYEYRTDKNSEGQCVPDVVLIYPHAAIVIEVKYTYVPEAIEKLLHLYCPVVEKAHGLLTKPLVLCKRLTEFAPAAAFDLGSALEMQLPLLMWMGQGPIPLGRTALWETKLKLRPAAAFPAANLNL